MSQQNTPVRPQEEEIDLREELEKYLRRWPLFVVGVIFCLGLAFLYLHYTTPVYNTVATVIIKDEEKGGMPNELSAFADMGLLGGMSTSSIENEIGILKSKRLITNVAKDLNLNIRYFYAESIPPTEVFSERPFNIQLLAFDEQKFEKLAKEEEIEPLVFTILSDSTYHLQIEDRDFSKKMNFGESFSLPYAEISVTPNLIDLSEAAEKGEIKVTFSTLEDAAANYREKVAVNLTDKNSSLIELNLEDPVKSKAQQILNQLIHQYNQEAIADKNLVSQNTADFIEDRLAIITQELDSVETNKERFKKTNQLTDIEAESKLFIENASDFRNRQLAVETQLELARTMIEYLKSDKEGLLPANLGFEEGGNEGVANIINSYNQLVLERDRILAGSTENNPVIVNLNNQISQIRANVLESLNNMKTSLLIAKKDLDTQEAKIDAQIAKVPSKEKQFRNIERQQNIKEALYLFLLQKREETSLSLAVTAPKAKIVDAAYSSHEPVSPKPKIILLAALILGLLLPFLYIYIKNLLNNKVQNRTDIEDVTKEIPIVGEVPRIGRKESDLITNNDRSVLAESFRILHTNLQYLLINAGDKFEGNTIFVTSTVKGEGKTFVAFNTALTLAHSGKKVLLVGGDLRNPQLQRYETDARSFLGVSDYLINDELKLNELITPSNAHSDVHLLASGSIPPNPSELWRRKKTASLFKDLEGKYDYVIVDTAPCMLVTDTFLINKYADIILYVTRAGYTEKKLLNFALDAKKEGKLHNVSFVLNDVELANFGYGNKYGYAYGEETESFWKKLRGKAAFWSL